MEQFEYKAFMNQSLVPKPTWAKVWIQQYLHILKFGYKAYTWSDAWRTVEYELGSDTDINLLVYNELINFFKKRQPVQATINILVQ